MNRVNLIGRTTKDGELKQTPTGISVVQFVIAVPKQFNNKESDFLNCIAWRQTAEYFCKYIKKGSLIAISGRIETRKYQGKDGTEKVAVEIICDSIENLSPKPVNEGNTLDGLDAPSEDDLI